MNIAECFEPSVAGAAPGVPDPLDPDSSPTGLSEQKELRVALAAALNHTEAARTVCRHLRRSEALLPSVYLERAGLLRCIAQSGYWQILDGLQHDVGILSAAVRSGQRVELADVAASDEFLAAVPGIRAEVAVPIWVHGKIVGGLNVESRRLITGAEHLEIDRCARLLGRRFEIVGTDVPDTPLSRLARSSKQLAGLSELPAVRQAVLDTALAISGMSSAVLIERDESERLEITTALGPLAGVFRSLPTSEIDHLAAMVERVSSCYTAGDSAGRPAIGTDMLRQSGAVEVAVFPLLSLGRRVGILVVAHDAAKHLSTEETEPLELLATESARCLELARLVTELRHRASRDPLTELGNHSAFYEALTHRNAPYALAMLDIDNFKSINDLHGHLTGDRLLRDVANAIQRSVKGSASAYRVGGDEFAVVLPEQNLQAATRICETLCRSALTILEPYGASMSAGITIVHPDEHSHDVVNRADQLLYAAKRAGRNQTHAE